MCVGHISQKQALIDGDIVPLIVKVLTHGGSITQEEGVWAVMNLTSGTIHQISESVICGVIPPLCNILSSIDLNVTIPTLKAIENILKAAQTINKTLHLLTLLGLRTLRVRTRAFCPQVGDKLSRILEI